MANDTITLASIDLTTTWGLYFGDTTMQAMTPVDLEQYGLPTAIGGLALYRGMQPQRISLKDCIVIPPSGKTVAECLTGISAALYNAQQANVRLDLGAWTDRYWMVKYTGDLNIKYLPKRSSFNLEFIAEDPRAYASSATTITDTWTSGDYTEVITPAGSAPCEPIISVRSMYASGTKSLVLSGTFLSAEQTISIYLHQGQWVRWDCRQNQQCIYRSSNYPVLIEDCVWIAYMNGVSGRFPTLTPGVANTLTISGLMYATLTKVQIDYNARYFA